MNTIKLGLLTVEEICWITEFIGNSSNTCLCCTLSCEILVHKTFYMDQSL